MKPDYWIQQTIDKPAFPDILWSRPENRRHAGKLTIIGGHAQSFADTANSFTCAQKAGIGSARAILPDALQKLISSFLPEAYFAPSNPSGSFARSSIDTWLEHAAWADGTLIAGDLGHNSETSIVLESFLQKHNGLTVTFGGAIDTYLASAAPNTSKEDVWFVANLAQAQKLASAYGTTNPVTSSVDLLHLVELLHQLTAKTKLQLVLQHSGNILVASKGKVSTTLANEKTMPELASLAAVWALQHPNSQFESITTAIHQSLNK